MLGTGAVRSFGPGHVHDVRNERTERAVSIHVYSPPLLRMRRYGVAADGQLRVVARGTRMVSRHGRPIDAILKDVRRRLRRLDPAQAYAALRAGALLVDIRPQAQRTAEGGVPGALVIERNVLEWRFDPRCDARLPFVDGYDLLVIIMCSQGYTSSLAAASLQDLGLRNATDLVGGFLAWAAADLPVVPGNLPRPVQAGDVGLSGDC